MMRAFAPIPATDHYWQVYCGKCGEPYSVAVERRAGFLPAFLKPLRKGDRPERFHESRPNDALTCECPVKVKP
jgi:hypothetical protein